MKNIIKSILFAGLFVFLVASPVATVVTPQPTYAAGPGNCEAYLLGVIPPWYRGLTEEKDNTCVIKPPADSGGLSAFIWKIVLNILQMILMIIGLIAVFFIIYGGFLFITGGSNSSQLEKARKTILNAIIGLVISMGAIAVTNLIFSLLSGASTANEFGVPEIQAQDLLGAGLNLAYYIAGIVAVIVIIVGGINYATSAGDSGRVAKAKNMILYAVVGIVVLLAAFAITNFVIARFK